MNYNLAEASKVKHSLSVSLRKLWPLIAPERTTLILALVAILANSMLNLIAPRLIGHAVDKYLPIGDYHGVLVYCVILLSMYLAALVTSYAQTRLMGGVGQRVLFNLRNSVFSRLQTLPVAFFSQNKAGDLISRINNDTDKLNQFFSQTLMQFVGSIFIMIGSAIFMVSIKPNLGMATLAPAVVLVLFTQALSGWIKRKNSVNMKALGSLSGEIQESLDNFKVIVAFNRRDYFREKFAEANEYNYKTSISAGIANNVFTPVYGMLASFGQLIVLTYGIYLVAHGHFSLGLLISFLSYTNTFYSPLKQIAALWTNLQVAIAAWERVSQILDLETDLGLLVAATTDNPEHILEFKNVSFSYPGREVLHNISFALDAGKTYALVGPTGGGKTTTASLMARLYDPASGKVLLDGRDLRAYTPAERSAKIGFILQEPFLFTGTVRENIVYGNEEYKDYSNEQLEAVIHSANLGQLLERFEEGLDTKVQSSGDSISLGQKQLIAFMRAVLRKPEILILDEATANVDTITEQTLETILHQLPESTTRVIIAHRLNTIANADEIFFVNTGEVVQAGSMEHAVSMLLHGKRKS